MLIKACASLFSGLQRNINTLSNLCPNDWLASRASVNKARFFFPIYTIDFKIYSGSRHMQHQKSGPLKKSDNLRTWWTYILLGKMQGLSEFRKEKISSTVAYLAYCYGNLLTSYHCTSTVEPECCRNNGILSIKTIGTSFISNAYTPNNKTIR